MYIYIYICIAVIIIVANTNTINCFKNLFIILNVENIQNI